MNLGPPPKAKATATTRAGRRACQTISTFPQVSDNPPPFNRLEKRPWDPDGGFRGASRPASPSSNSLVSRRARLWAAPPPARTQGGVLQGPRRRRPREELPAARLHKTAPEATAAPGRPAPRRRPPRPGALGARPGRRATPLVVPTPPRLPAGDFLTRRESRPGRTVPSGRRRASG